MRSVPNEPERDVSKSVHNVPNKPECDAPQSVAFGSNGLAEEAPTSVTNASNGPLGGPPQTWVNSSASEPSIPADVARLPDLDRKNSAVEVLPDKLEVGSSIQEL